MTRLDMTRQIRRGEVKYMRYYWVTTNEETENKESDNEYNQSNPLLYCYAISFFIESILLIILHRTLKKYLCASFPKQVLFSLYDKNSMSCEEFDLEKCLKREKFCVIFFIKTRFFL